MAGIKQMNAYGTQDALLTSVPQISFWKGNVKRYTSFAVEQVQCVWNNTVGFGRRSTAMLPHTGHLVSNMWLEIDLPDLTQYAPVPNTATNIKWAQSIALIMINSIQLEVGSARVDQYSGYFHDFWSELAECSEKRKAFDEMVGRFENYDNTSATHSSSAARTYFVPLLFFPNTASSQNVPMCAMPFNEVRVNMELRNYLDCVRSSLAPVQSLINTQGNPLDVVDVRLYVDFVYLSAPEKDRFVRYNHDILYTYLQDSGQTPVVGGSQSCRVTLTFSNAVQELIFVYQPKASFASNTMTGNRWTDVLDAFASVDLQLDGSSRFTPQVGTYFSFVQPYMYHTACPRKPVHCYSFARRPEDAVQPSGALNCSRIGSMSANFTLKPNLPDGYITFYARTFNVLTIAGGKASLNFA